MANRNHLIKSWRRIAKIIVSITGTLWILGILTTLSVNIKLVRTAPRLPQPDTGNVVPYNVHGTYVYITHLQDLMWRSAFFGGWAAGFITLAIGMIVFKWHRKKSNSRSLF